MSREIHVRFCEGLGVRFPRATRQRSAELRDADASEVSSVCGEIASVFGLEIHRRVCQGHSSHPGCCYDNAVMERFFWSLKHKWTKFDSFPDIEDARLSVSQYIEAFYNPQRIIRTLGYKSPKQFEPEHEAKLAA